MKTAKIKIESVKDSDGWFELIVDENFNIVGGKIIPSGK